MSEKGKLARLEKYRKRVAAGIPLPKQININDVVGKKEEVKEKPKGNK